MPETNINTRYSQFKWGMITPEFTGEGSSYFSKTPAVLLPLEPILEAINAYTPIDIINGGYLEVGNEFAVQTRECYLPGRNKLYYTYIIKQGIEHYAIQVAFDRKPLLNDQCDPQVQLLVDGLVTAWPMQCVPRSFMTWVTK